MVFFPYGLAVVPGLYLCWLGIEIMVFNADGQPVLRWRVIDDLVLDPVGLAVSQYGGVYVWDAQNRVVGFVSASPFLVPFPEADPD